MNYDSVILLGYHGVGKDTLADALIKDYEGFAKAKFSSYPKHQLAAALEVPEEWMEDKQWLNAPVNERTEVSALDLLNLMFYGRDSMPMFAQRTIDYCFECIPEGKTPIFVDVRQQKEYDAVLSKFDCTLVLLLTRDGINKGLGDDSVNDLFHKSLIAKEQHLSNQTVESAKLRLVQYLEPPIRRPILRVFISDTPLTSRQTIGLATYEPMESLVVAVMDFMKEQKISHEVFQKLFSLVKEEAAAVEILPPKPNSYMVYHESSHYALLPKIRKFADLKLMIDRSFSGNKKSSFTTEELSNATLY